MTKIQKHVTESDPKLSQACVPVPKAHLTLFVFNADDQVEKVIETVQSVIEKIEFKDELTMEANEIGHFNHSVVYAKLKLSPNIDDLWAQLAQELIKNEIIEESAKNQFRPHLTLMKLSKMKKPKKGQKRMKKIPPELYVEYQNAFLGVQKVKSIQLLSMTKPATDGYYYCQHTFPLNFEVEQPSSEPSTYTEVETRQILPEPVVEVKELSSEPVVEDQPMVEVEQLSAEPVVEDQPEFEVKQISPKPMVEVEQLSAEPVVEDQQEFEANQVSTEVKELSPEQMVEVKELTPEPVVEVQQTSKAVVEDTKLSPEPMVEVEELTPEPESVVEVQQLSAKPVVEEVTKLLPEPMVELKQSSPEPMVEVKQPSSEPMVEVQATSPKPVLKIQQPLQEPLVELKEVTPEPKSEPLAENEIQEAKNKTLFEELKVTVPSVIPIQSSMQNDPSSSSLSDSSGSLEHSGICHFIIWKSNCFENYTSVIVLFTRY